MVLLLGLVPPLLAAQTTPEAPAGGSQTLDQSHRVISDTLLFLPAYLDNFFSAEHIEDETNTSRFRLFMGGFYQKGQHPNYFTRFSAKIILPKTQRRWRFSLEGTSDEATELGEPPSGQDPPSGQATPGEALTETQQQAAIEAIVRRTRDWRINAILGLKFGTPLDPFVRVRARHYLQRPEWQLRFTTNLYSYLHDGPGASFQFDADQPISEALLFRATSSIKYHKVSDLVGWSQRFSYFYKLDDPRVVSYGVAAYGTSDPNYHVHTYLIELRYRQQIYSDWMYLEFIPELRFLKEQNFETLPGFTFRLEALFGKRR